MRWFANILEALGSQIKCSFSDIDECASSNLCSISDRCINTLGAYNCEQKVCTDGYSLNFETGDCDDIDECLTEPCVKNLKCFNTLGSYDCDCDYGYRNDLYRKNTCRDIDECLEHPGKLLRVFFLTF
jgi:hypothetical protein